MRPPSAFDSRKRERRVVHACGRVCTWTHTQGYTAARRGHPSPDHLHTGTTGCPAVSGATATRPAGTEGHSHARHTDSASLESSKINRILTFYEHRGQNKDPKKG